MNNNLKNWSEIDDLQVLETSLTKTHVANENNLMLVDSNNLGYRWLKSKKHNSFGDEYLRTVESLGKSYSAKEIICLFDFGKSYYRMEIHPEYKSTRKKPETEEEQKHYDEFFECLNTLQELLPYDVYKYRGVEADDTITYFVENLKNHYDNIWIITSDRDMYQLVDDNIHIFNIFGRKEITVDSILIDYELNPSEYLLARLIEGDKSDSITGIEGVGPIRSQNLARTYKTLESLLKAIPIKGTSQYIKNLNANQEILSRNDRLINLKKHHEEAIKSGKGGDLTWKELQARVTSYT